MRTSRILRAATACVLFAVAAGVTAEENPADSLLPDFYNDPSLSTSGIKLEDYESSSVDYFSGTMRRSATDFVLPGNGGLSIEFKRNYTSLQPASWPDYTAVGVGWTMHFGWIEITDIEKMCNPLWSVSIMDNPMVHLPDGSSDVLALTDEPMADPTKIHYRGKSGVGVSCGAVLVGVDAAPFIMVTPDGKRYEFERWSVGGALFGFHKTAKWYVRRIQDRHGNWIAIDNRDVGDQASTGTIVAPVRVSASDGREVLLEYADGLLRRIVQGTDTLVEYAYEPADMDSGHYANLVRVELREELAWTYAYSAKREAGAGSMVRAANPIGGSTDYTWHRQYFLTGDDAELNAVVAQVTQDASGSPSATWQYTYAPATAVGARDITTVRAPEGVYQYIHFSALGMVSGEVWKVGLTERVVFTPNTGPVKTEDFTWTTYYISAENNKRTKASGLYAAVDLAYYGALQSGKTTRIGTATWKVASSDWLWGPGYIGQPQAQTIVHTGPDGTQRKQNRRFHQRPQWHLYFLPFQEWTTQALFPDATTSQTEYNDLGDAVSRFDRGFFTFYTWDAQGNLASTTRGLNADRSQGQARVTTHGDYHRGVARLTTHPDGTTTRLEVDDFGRTVEAINREGAVTRYAYDGLGRVTRIDYPTGNDAQLVYAGTRTVLTRGNYRRETRTDGFGRVVEEAHADTAAGRVITVQRAHDSAGRVVFTSMPNSNTVGSRYSYDDHGRITRVVHPGGQRSYTYVDGQRVDVTDENGNVTQMHRLAVFGPGEGDLVRIVSPGNIVTRITRNEYGLPLKIEQGNGTTMKARTNTYNASLVLTASNDPELGTTTYGYDVGGNLTRITRPDGVTGLFDFQINEYDLNDRVVRTWIASNQIVSGSAKHTYDARLEFRWTPEGRPLEQARYQTIGHYAGSASRGQESSWNTWQFEYDANGNALVERATINGISREFRYAWDGNDRLQALTYPDGYTLDYAPDAFGWPTRAGDYATSVRYHPTGQLAGFTYGNGRRIDLAVNQRYLVEGIRVPGVAGLAYAYDPAGNVRSIVDELDPSQNVALQYTASNRLLAANGPWGEGSFGYDAWGNLTRKNIGADKLTYTYDSRNRLTRISGSRTRTYVYDGFGNVKQKSSAWFGYDGLGNLIESRKDMGYNASSVHASHEFDARNRRVATRRGAATSYSLQANGDRLLWEFETVDNTWVRHVFLGNVLVARTENYVGCWDDLDGDGIPHCVEQEAGLDPRDATDADGDRDGDGLTNIDEYLRGTSINDSDTDNDGILDGIEVSVGMDPRVDDASADLDGDGIPNNVEFARGFNPADPSDGAADHDGDGLSTGAEYALGTAWNDADTDNDGFSDGYEVRHGLDPRVADADADRDGDGLPNSYEYAIGFNPGDPSDGAADADNDGLTNAREYAAGLEMFVPDTDGDGLLDGVEVAHGLAPLSHDYHLDKDGDGIPNGWELSHGLDPADAGDAAADPDGDGVSTRDEYLADTDPWQAEYLGPVTGIRVAPDTDGNIVAWAAQPRAADYVVRYGVLGESGAITLSGYTDRALDHGGLVPDTLYWYQVNARDTGGAEIPGETVTAMTGPRRDFALPVVLPATCNHKPQIVLVGDGDFLFACEAGVDRLDLYRYRRGELRFQRSFVIGEQNENPGWSLVGTEDGNALLRWSGSARLEMRWFEFHSRYNVRRDRWTDPDVVVDFPFSSRTDLPEHTVYGNWDGRYTLFHSEVAEVGSPSSSQRRYESRIFRSQADGMGPWARSTALVSGKRLSGLKAAGPDEVVLRSSEQDAYLVERFWVEYLRRSGASYVLRTLATTSPWRAQLDADDKVFAYTNRMGETGGFRSGWFRVCGECAVPEPYYDNVFSGSNDGTPAQLSVLAFAGVGGGQVLRVMPGAIDVARSSITGDNVVSWSPSQLLVDDPALTDPGQVIAARSRRNGWLLWNNDAGQALIMEGRRDGTWSTPEVVSTGAPVVAADADHAGNLVYVLRDAGQYVFRERRRQPSYVSADADLTPPVVAHATVRTAGSTVRHVVTLSADEPANLFFRVSGGTVQAGGTNTTAEQRYIGPLTITVPNGSQATLVFRGINQARRWSAPVTVTLP